MVKRQQLFEITTTETVYKCKYTVYQNVSIQINIKLSLKTNLKNFNPFKRTLSY